jgi:hypothetical protein
VARRDGSSNDENSGNTPRKAAFDPCAEWPKDLPKPKPWQAVVDLQRTQTATEIAATEQSLRADGVKYPPVLMPDGRIIDGHVRFRLASNLRLPLPPPILMPEGTTDEEGIALARACRSPAAT